MHAKEQKYYLRITIYSFFAYLCSRKIKVTNGKL